MRQTSLAALERLLDRRSMISLSPLSNSPSRSASRRVPSSGKSSARTLSRRSRDGHDSYRPSHLAHRGHRYHRGIAERFDDTRNPEILIPDRPDLVVGSCAQYRIHSNGIASQFGCGFTLTVQFRPNASTYINHATSTRASTSLSSSSVSSMTGSQRSGSCDVPNHAPATAPIVSVSPPRLTAVTVASSALPASSPS